MGPRPVSPQCTSVWGAAGEMGQCVEKQRTPTNPTELQSGGFICGVATHTHTTCMRVSFATWIFYTRPTVSSVFLSLFWEQLTFNRQPFCDGCEKWSRFNEWLRNRKWVSDVGCGGHCSGWARGPHILYPRALLHHMIVFWETFLPLCSSKVLEKSQLYSTLKQCNRRTIFGPRQKNTIYFSTIKNPKVLLLFMEPFRFQKLLFVRHLYFRCAEWVWYGLVMMFWWCNQQ